jgi:hypothetical protein
MPSLGPAAPGILGDGSPDSGGGLDHLAINQVISDGMIFASSAYKYAFLI